MIHKIGFMQQEALQTKPREPQNTVAGFVLDRCQPTVDTASISEQYVELNEPPAPKPSSPYWMQLEDHLHRITDIVPATSADLARTTVLTWMYRNEGFIRFIDIADKIDGDIHRTHKKKMARRALRSLEKIGAVTLLSGAKDHQTPRSSCPADEFDQAVEDDEQGCTPIGSDTCAQMTANGMKWMQRAFHARHVSINAYCSPAWVHAVLLEEEEDGKGNDPHWIDSNRSTDSRFVETHTQCGEVTSWIGPLVTSIFDLASSQAADAQAKKKSAFPARLPRRSTLDRAKPYAKLNVNMLRASPAPL